MFRLATQIFSVPAQHDEKSDPLPWKQMMGLGFSNLSHRRLTILKIPSLTVSLHTLGPDPCRLWRHQGRMGELPLLCRSPGYTQYALRRYLAPQHTLRLSIGTTFRRTTILRSMAASTRYAYLSTVAMGTSQQLQVYIQEGLCNA